MKPLTLRLWDALGLLPTAEGKTQPVAHYLAILSYPPFERTPTMIDAKDFKGDIFDSEYCTPQQAAEMRAMREDKLESTTMSAPAATYITVLRMEAEFLPLDVLIHRALNGTEGKESEE